MNTNTATRRYARITGMGITPSAIANYMPRNYSVLFTADDATVTISGVDNAGWTLDDYVLPRLASGMYFGTEVLEEDLAGRELDAERFRRLEAYDRYVVECDRNLCVPLNMSMWSASGEPEEPGR